VSDKAGGLPQEFMNSEARHELDLLEALSEDATITQRSLSAKLGIALGLTNIYLKRLARKGYVKCVNVRSNRLVYLLTPTGIAEKTRLTCEFMDYSLRLYRDVRQRLRLVLAPLVNQRGLRVAIYGTGEAAELAYLGLKEFGLDPVGVFADESGPAFFSIPVGSIRELSLCTLDAVIVATLENPVDVMLRLQEHGIPREKLLTLREPIAPAPFTATITSPSAEQDL
jgi:DNA-binding MarR family transcriptional regulator